MRTDNYDFGIENGIYHFIIWGTGNNALRVLDYLDSVKQTIGWFSYTIDAFIDNDIRKHGTKFANVTVCSSEYLEDNSISKSIIIVGIFNSSEVEQMLGSRGITKYITSRELIHDEVFSKYLIKKNNELLNKKALAYRNQYRIFLDDGQYEIDDIPEVYKLSAATCEFGEDIIEADQVIKTKRQIVRKSTKHVTIAIYYHRLHNGGIERVISQLLPLYISYGYKVILFTSEISDDDYDVPDKVERCVLPAVEPLAPYDWLEKFYKYIIEKDIDIIINHAHGDYRSYYLGKLANSLGVKYIIESHTSIHAIKSKGMEEYCRVLYSTSDCLVNLSRYDAEYWSKQGIDSSYIPNPVQLPEPTDDSNYNQREILWVGRIDVIEKNVYEIVPVMRKVKEKVPDAKLKLIGKEDDPLVLKELKQIIRENDLESCIELCGYKTNLESYYQNAAVLFMTSPYEGFPMTVVESKSYGLPIVMYEIEGIELTKDRLGVVEVPQGDSTAMANAIVSILNSCEERNRLSGEARLSIEKFAAIDIGKMWQDVINN